jgi:hypothetical protein
MALNFFIPRLSETIAPIHNIIISYLDFTSLSYYADDQQIIENTDRLDWEILSTRDLSSEVVLQCSNMINWQTFLMSKHAISISILRLCKNHVMGCGPILVLPEVRHRYTPEFISEFSVYVDWVWIVQNVKLPAHSIIKNWDYIDPNLVIIHQKIPEVLIMAKQKSLNWSLICIHQKLPISMIEVYKHRVFWNLLFIHQSLPEDFIYIYRHSCKNYEEVIPTHNFLSEEFIAGNLSWLDINSVSQMQPLSYSFINANKTILNFELLAKNENLKAHVFKVNDEFITVDKFKDACFKHYAVEKN